MNNVQKAKHLLDEFLMSHSKRSSTGGWPEVTSQEWGDLHYLISAIIEAKYEDDSDGDSVIRYTIVNRNVHEPFSYCPVLRDDQPDSEKHVISKILLNMRLAVHAVERYLDQRLDETGYWIPPKKIESDNTNYQDQGEIKMYNLQKTQEEIDDLVNQCAESEETGRNKYPGMSYEQGIKAAIDWLLDTGMDGDHPLND